MNSMLPNALFDLWQQGRHLGDAFWEFAPAKYLEAYQRANSFPTTGSDITPHREQEKLPSNFDRLYTLTQALVDRMQAVADRTERRNQEMDIARDRIEDFLLQGLRNGRFIALGYLMPRSASDLPTQLPIDIFENNYIDWENSSAIGNGLEFVAVRVVKNTKKKLKNIGNDENPAQKLIASHQKPEIAKRPSGRPSMTNVILSAYDELYSRGQISKKETNRSIYSKVCSYISEHRPDAKLPGEEAVRRAIVRFRNL